MRIDFTAGAAGPKFVLDRAASVHELAKRGARHHRMAGLTNKE
jgi:hypothetical protein